MRIARERIPFLGEDFLCCLHVPILKEDGLDCLGAGFDPLDLPLPWVNSKVRRNPSSLLFADPPLLLGLLLLALAPVPLLPLFLFPVQVISKYHFWHDSKLPWGQILQRLLPWLVPVHQFKISG